jgi:hypothetical protein
MKDGKYLEPGPMKELGFDLVKREGKDGEVSDESQSVTLRSDYLIGS